MPRPTSRAALQQRRAIHNQAIAYLSDPDCQVWSDVVLHGTREGTLSVLATSEQVRDYFMAKHSRLLWCWTHNVHDMARRYSAVHRPR